MAAEHSRIDGGEVTLFKSIRHEHDLRKFEDLHHYICTGCKEDGVNFGYACSVPSCNSIFHVPCATLEDEKQHPIQNNLKFRFRDETLFTHRCTACDHELGGFEYESSDMRLHPLCLMLPPMFEYDGKNFRLVMSKGNAYRCYDCRETIEHGWKYMCKDDVMDVGCAKYYIHGLRELGIHSSKVCRRRDILKYAAKSSARYVVPAAGVAGGVAGVVDCFTGCLGG